MRCWFLIYFYILSSFAYGVTNNVYHIGISAPEGHQLAIRKWQSTAQLLQNKIPNASFKIIPIGNFEKIEHALVQEKIDFLIIDPIAYLQLKSKYKLQHVVSLINHRGKNLATHYSSVIFTKTIRDDIETLQDINGKTVMGASLHDLGGWLMAQREFKKYAIIPRKIIYSPHGNHSKVVDAVLNDRADIGIVRTGILEQMLENKLIVSEQIKIINSQKDSFPLSHSTRIYPEWPFAVTPQIPQQLVREVMIALYSIGASDQAAIDGGYTGWGSALDYGEVENLLNELNLIPTKHHDQIAFASLWKQHKWLILFASIGILSLISFFVYLIWLNEKLKLTKKNLAIHQEELESKVRERTFGLLEYHKFSQDIINGVSDPLMVVDMDLNVLTRNQAAQKWVSNANSKKGQLKCYELSHNRDRPCEGLHIPCPFIEVMRTGKACTKIHEIDKNGQIITLEVTATPLHDEKGQLNGIVESFHDISQHMRLMRKLGKKEQYLSTVMNSVHDGIVTINKEAQVLQVNNSIYNLLGYTPNELKNTNISDLLINSDKQRYSQFRHKRDLHQLTRLLSRTSLEITAKHKDGHILSLEMRLGELTFEDEIQFLLVLRDISTRKKLQNDLEKSRRQFYYQDKMTTVGQIAAGIIHEIGNPTASLVGLVQELKDIQREQNLLCANCEAPMKQIIENIDRIGNILNEVSEFTHPQASEIQLIDINHLVKNISNIIKYEQTIQFLPLKLQLGTDLAAVNVKPDQISQVLMNILINAIEACSHNDLHLPNIILSTWQAKKRIHILVSDNGIGMDDGTLQKVFNIDYSTKTEHLGHGLGLSLCQSIVQQHGGEITIHSSIGKGTDVEFYLPAVDLT
jgi:PAS domain S-box-containing protein